MLNFIVVILTALFVGCSSSGVKPSVDTKTQTNVTNKGPKTNAKVLRPKKIKKIRGTYNIDQAIRTVLPDDWEKLRWFESIDNKNGYAKMGAYMEGYYEYFLFVGTNRNLLAEVLWGCGPACEQTVKFYELKSSTHKKIHFSAIAAPRVTKIIGNKIRLCSTGLSFNSWDNKECSVMFSFAKVGTEVNVYDAKIFEDGRFQNEQGTTGEILTTLSWNKNLFRFDLKY